MIPSDQRIWPSAPVMQSDQANAVSGCETIQELFSALESPLLSYALRLAGELGAAEDSVQEAFMKLQAQFKEVREPRRWLYRTVHNLALNHRRRAGKIVALEVNARDASLPACEPADPQLLPDEQIVRSEGNRPGAVEPGNPGRAQPRIDPAQVQ